MYEVFDVSSWRLYEVDEQLGTKEKDWLVGPRGERWLFKQIRTKDGRDRGEDWAEKLVEQLALHLGVPVATAELAARSGARGIISRNFVPEGARLEHGNELLVRVDSDYDRDQARQNDRYTIEAVKLSLADAAPPDAYLVEGMTAFDIWAGYLVLDAWIAGRDRHHENWAVIGGHQRRVIAPSFDHGNALGFQESEERHQAMAASEERLLAWALRGTSPHFAGRPTLVQLAHSALAAASDGAREIWLGKLRDVSEDELQAIIDQVPSDRMSVAARTFCQKLLTLNQRRICDVS